jgi:hypothetical protein
MEKRRWGGAMKRKFAYEDLDLLQSLDLANYDSWEFDAELIVMPLTEDDVERGRPAQRFAHFGLGFCLGERPGYVFWFPSMAAARGAFGGDEEVKFGVWEFPHPPLGIVGAPREFLTPRMMEEIENGGVTHSWGLGGPRHGWLSLRVLRRNAEGELVVGPDYCWSWRKDYSRAPFSGIHRVGMDGMRAEDLGLWYGPDGMPKIRVVDGVQTVYPRTEEFFAKFRSSRPVKVDEDLVVSVGKRLLRWGAWDDPVMLAVAGPEEFGEDSDGGLLWWVADGEDLVEPGQVEGLLAAMTASLAKCGVSLSVETVSHPTVETPSYSVRVNGEMVELYRTRKGNPSEPLGRDPWMACTMKPLSVVNALLVSAGSVFRVGVVDPGGNDGIAFLFPESYWARLLNSEVFKHAVVKFPGIKKFRK